MYDSRQLPNYRMTFRTYSVKGRRAPRFFYCSGKKGPKTKTLEVLHTLIAQLAEFITGVFVSALVKKRYGNGNRNPIEIHECSKLLADLASEYQNTTIIVDALDECQDHDTLLLNLEEVLKMIHAAGKAVKLFLSSRNQVDVSECFPSCETLRLEHVAALNKEDMIRFVQAQVKEGKSLRLGSRILEGKHPERQAHRSAGKTRSRNASCFCLILSYWSIPNMSL